MEAPAGQGPAQSRSPAWGADLDFDWRSESVSAPRHRFDVARPRSVVAQGLAQGRDGGVDRGFMIDRLLPAPEVLPYLVTGDRVTGAQNE